MTTITATAEIELQPGERYAGVVLDKGGRARHHLIKLPGAANNATHQQAIAWAASIGGVLPDRQEQALLFANCKPYLPDHQWCWSGQLEDATLGWLCDFRYGFQGTQRRSAKYPAVAVRRIPART